jgi:hypothetical protein
MEVEMSDYGRQILIVVDGGIGEAYMQLGTVTELADLLERAHYADYDITEVYALSQLNELKAINWTVVGGDTFDEDQWAHLTVTVVFSDGAREQAHYRLDGRA